MNCPKCGNEMQINTSTHAEVYSTRRKGWKYWLFGGWLLEPLLWIFLTLPKLIFELFKPKKVKTKTKIVKTAICNNCGYHANIK